MTFFMHETFINLTRSQSKAIKLLQGCFFFFFLNAVNLIFKEKNFHASTNMSTTSHFRCFDVVECVVGVF